MIIIIIITIIITLIWLQESSSNEHGQKGFKGKEDTCIKCKNIFACPFADFAIIISHAQHFLLINAKGINFY